jgi:Cu(I)/Ag(I) efflux system membrane protein CusA/SilA
MIETIILLKPHNEWRAGKTKSDIIDEINNKLQIPGVTNGFTQPIINRINMLSTELEQTWRENLWGKFRYHRSFGTKKLEGTEGVKDLYAEPITGGKYISTLKQNEVIGRYGLRLTM